MAVVFTVVVLDFFYMCRDNFILLRYVLSCHLIWTSDIHVDAPAEITLQEEGHTRFLHLPSAVLAVLFLARRIQPSLSLVDREV